MKAFFTEEQDLLRATLVRVFDDWGRRPEGERGSDGLFDRLVEIGCAELPGQPERGVLFEEAGYACAGGAIVPVLGVALPVLEDLDPTGALCAAVRAGTALPVVALDRFVVSADQATHLLVLEGDEVGVVERSGVRLEPVPSFDPGRPLAAFEVVAAPTIVGALADVRSVMAREGLLAVAHELTGIGRACLDVAVEHARTRLQFGRPIGSNQAISHQCVDMYIAVESARSHVYSAADAAERGDPSVELAVRQAHAVAADAAIFCAHRSIQVLGGLGFTWEHPAHRYLRRAQSSAHLVMDARSSRERVATLIGLGAGEGMDGMEES
ncbi:MAG TPA: acyl-CoA dehydrogenase family protein [Acidimicrobiales bacterium]|nr:acyl-CoA dehydrogenase family protein [Acidimicrobiales bacterium]